MKPAQIVLLFALLGGLLSGCSSLDDDRSRFDASAFVVDGEPAGRAVTLRLEELTSSSLALGVVAHEVSSLYGLAFRLEVDPAVLELDRMAAAPRWGSESTHIVAAKSVRPGLGFYVVTAKGDLPGESADDELVAIVHFKRVSGGASQVSFGAARNALVDERGKTVAGVRWIGGTLVREPLQVR